MSFFINSFFLYNPIKFLAILYPKSLANLVVEVGTRHSHQILLTLVQIMAWCRTCDKQLSNPYGDPIHWRIHESLSLDEEEHGRLMLIWCLFDQHLHKEVSLNFDNGLAPSSWATSHNLRYHFAKTEMRMIANRIFFKIMNSSDGNWIDICPLFPLRTWPTEISRVTDNNWNVNIIWSLSADQYHTWSRCLCKLIHQGLNKMAAILEMTFSNDIFQRNVCILIEISLTPVP